MEQHLTVLLRLRNHRLPDVNTHWSVSSMLLIREGSMPQPHRWANYIHTSNVLYIVSVSLFLLKVINNFCSLVGGGGGKGRGWAACGTNNIICEMRAWTCQRERIQ